jgi:hypothetical protein
MKEYICKEVQTENGGYLEIETELIRCKDCKFNPRIIVLGCPMAGSMSRNDESFCSVGKRRKTRDDGSLCAFSKDEMVDDDG